MTPTSISIRTYQVGFGDCFLLSFAYADGHEAHVLIDFGSTGLPKAATKKHLLNVAADIQARTGGQLDVVVATHRHKDHISGFATSSDGKGTGDVIAALKPRAVIQPWTEDPQAKRDAVKATTRADGQVRSLSERRALHVASLDEMRGVAAAAVKVNDRMRKVLGFETADRLKFIADDNLPNESAVKNLAAMGARGQALYVHAGMALDLSALLPGVKVHVLGPPDLEQTDGIRKQRSSDEAEFWHFWRKSAAAGAASVSTRGGGEALFARDFIWQGRDKPPSARWFSQRITEAHGGALMELVRVLDDAMNNTSVILLFEVGGKKLLFPGDAQLENWAYAVTLPGVAALLEDVDVYKVGHHGSLNATPKQLLWRRFKKKKSSAEVPLQSLLSTMHGKHGDDARGTEVPRSTLLTELKKETRLLDTQAFTGLFEDTVIDLEAPRAPKKAATPKQRAAPEDPLRQLKRAATKPGRTAKRFEGGEHLWLGNAGAALACTELRREGLDLADEEFLSISRLRGDEALQYGELVALSGDFYESPAELFEERPAPLPWLYEANDVSELRALFRVELAWISERQRGLGAAAWPDQNVRFWWNAKSFTELAQKNVDHFGWHNMKAYCRYHGAALALARQANGRGGELWQRALTYNAFADHFLTDGFAAGHVRVPRRELIAWGAAQGYSERLTGVLSKVLHDQDGHVSTLHGAGDHAGPDDGLAVRNARGVRWKTFCDGQLFLYPGAATQPHVREASRAVSASVKELVRAWKTGALPPANYEAAEYVAFPDRGQTLSEKFAAFDGARVKALHRSVAGYLKVLSSVTPAHLRAVFDALPALLETFRAHVAEDIRADAALPRRLPRAYIDAYLRLK